MKSEVMRYGVNEIGQPYREPEGGGWFRIDTYTSNEPGSRPDRYRVFCAGTDDLSPIASTWYAGHGNCQYHPRCSCCYLGFSHTLDLHKREAVGSWD